MAEDCGDNRDGLSGGGELGGGGVRVAAVGGRAAECEAVEGARCGGGRAVCGADEGKWQPPCSGGKGQDVQRSGGEGAGPAYGARRGGGRAELQCEEVGARRDGGREWRDYFRGFCLREGSMPVTVACRSLRRGRRRKNGRIKIE